jgi:hypothetical protein
MGEVFDAEYPASPDPDSTDTLNVDLTESLGELSTFASSQQNLFIPLCAIAGGGTIPVTEGSLNIPFELISYGTATLLDANQYALAPPIRRGCQGMPIAAHPIGSFFLYLGPGAVFYRYSLPQNLVGIPLYFKFASYAGLGSGPQQLPDCTAYSFTPSGQVGWYVAPGTPWATPRPVTSRTPTSFYLPEDYVLPTRSWSSDYQVQPAPGAEDLPAATLAVGVACEEYWLGSSLAWDTWYRTTPVSDMGGLPTLPVFGLSEDYYLSSQIRDWEYKTSQNFNDGGKS